MARVLAVAFVVLVAAGAASARVVQPHGVRTPLGEPRKTALTQGISSEADLETQVLLAVNAERAKHGLVPLRVSRQLAVTARAHSTSMAEHGYFAHESFDGSAFWRRIKAAYPELRGRSWGAGENLVWASPDLSAQQALDMWLSSPRHRQNMLAPRWREVGIGGVHALAAPGVYEGLDVTIVTADFGVR